MENFEIVAVADLPQLSVRLTPGELTSNALEIRDMIREILPRFAPENFEEREECAAKELANLRKLKKSFHETWKRNEADFNKPLAEFKEICQSVDKDFALAEEKLRVIPDKIKSIREAKKRAKIQEAWDDTGFSLFPMERVFSTKWLPESAKMKEIEAEIAQIQKNALDDLQNIEKMELGADEPLVKALYVDTLDFGAAVRKANELKANRELLAREQEERKKAELRAQAAEQKKEISQAIRETQIEKRLGRLDKLGDSVSDVEPSDAEPVETVETAETSQSPLFAAPKIAQSGLTKWSINFVSSYEDYLKIASFIVQKGLPFKAYERVGDDWRILEGGKR